MFISQKDIPGDVNSSWEGGGVGVCCKSNFRLLDFLLNSSGRIVYLV